MSDITRWLLIGALVVVVLFAANAIFYRVRFGTFAPRRSGREPFLRQNIPRSELAVLGAGVALMFIGLIARDLAPTSAFGVWIRGPYSLLACGLWLVLGPTLVLVAGKVAALLRRTRGNSSNRGLDA
jgi:hypothetical protein